MDEITIDRNEVIALIPNSLKTNLEAKLAWWRDLHGDEYIAVIAVFIVLTWKTFPVVSRLLRLRRNGRLHLFSFARWRLETCEPQAEKTPDHRQFDA